MTNSDILNQRLQQYEHQFRKQMQQAVADRDQQLAEVEGTGLMANISRKMITSSSEVLINSLEASYESKVKLEKKTLKRCLKHGFDLGGYTAEA